MKAAAPIREMCGRDQGEEVGGPGSSSGLESGVGSSGGASDVRLSRDDSDIGEVVGGTVVRKEMVRADQSTNGLKAVSQLRPKTAVDGESSLVT